MALGNNCMKPTFTGQRQFLFNIYKQPLQDANNTLKLKAYILWVTYPRNYTELSSAVNYLLISVNYVNTTPLRQKNVQKALL